MNGRRSRSPSSCSKPRQKLLLTVISGRSRQERRTRSSAKGVFLYSIRKVVHTTTRSILEQQTLSLTSTEKYPNSSELFTGSVARARACRSKLDPSASDYVVRARFTPPEFEDTSLAACVINARASSQEGRKGWSSQLRSLPSSLSVLLRR